MWKLTAMVRREYANLKWTTTCATWVYVYLTKAKTQKKNQIRSSNYLLYDFILLTHGCGGFWPTLASIHWGFWTALLWSHLNFSIRLRSGHRLDRYNTTILCLDHCPVASVAQFDPSFSCQTGAKLAQIITSQPPCQIVNMKCLCWFAVHCSW